MKSKIIVFSLTFFFSLIANSNVRSHIISNLGSTESIGETDQVRLLTELSKLIVTAKDNLKNNKIKDFNKNIFNLRTKLGHDDKDHVLSKLSDKDFFHFLTYLLPIIEHTKKYIYRSYEKMYGISFDDAKNYDLRIVEEWSHYSKDIENKLKLVAKDWAFKGEGANNIVLRYHGNDIRLKHYVLRIKKRRDRSYKKVIGDKDSMNIDIHKQRQNAILGYREYVFIKTIMEPFLGKKYVNVGEVIPIKSSFIKSIYQKIEKDRPLHRRKVSYLDINAGYAQFIPDYTNQLKAPYHKFNEISFEIKPKIGFISKSPFLNYRKQKSFIDNISFYQMKQHYKNSKGDVKGISHYDPLDLFSSDIDKRKDAILELINAYPQNNFRVFRNGELEYGGDAKKQNFEQVVKNLYPFESQDLKKEVATLISLVLKKENVLENILQAQKLDNLDYRGAKILLDLLEKDGVKLSNKIIWEEIFKRSYDLNEFKKFNNFLSITDEKIAIKALNNLSSKEKLSLLRRYLIAFTAQDCSLILTIKKVEDEKTNNKNILEYPKGHYFTYQVGVVDFDPRDYEKIFEKYKLYKKIIKVYESQFLSLNEKITKNK